MLLAVLRAQVRIHHVNLRYNATNQNLGVRFSRTELSEGPVLAALRDLAHRIEGQLALPEAYDGWAETLIKYKAHISNV